MLLKNSRGDMFSGVPPLRADISRESSADIPYAPARIAGYLSYQSERAM